MKKFLLIVLITASFAAAAQRPDMAVLSWNVENFFDTYNDTATLDDDFTPLGANHWNSKRYQAKRNNIAKVVAAADFPDIVALVEVENDYVLKDLCQGTPLYKQGYRFVHFDSPDPRGIDCALLYRNGRIALIEARPIDVSIPEEDFYTRDILLVHTLVDSVLPAYFLVCHLPSKRGGETAEQRRIGIADTLCFILDSLRTAHHEALVMAMGDFNAAPDEINPAPPDFENLMLRLPHDAGSYKYHGYWSFIDQVVLSDNFSPAAKVEVFQPDYLLTIDKKDHSRKPYRTYNGPAYQGGFSDHLPIRTCIDIER